MNKQFLIIVTIIVAALVGVFALTKNDDSSNGSGASGQPSNHVSGKSTRVTLVEYGDFQCPACKSFFPIVKQIKEEYKDKITFQFRHFPLTQIHPNAFAAHRAAEAAGRQEKFFEMHDLLYENQDAWAQASNPTQIFENYASQLGLNIEQYKTDVASESASDTINADVKLGQQIGANSTPTFTLNGEKIDNPKSLEEFKKLLDEAIRNSTGQ